MSRITLAHGSGGRAMQRLIQELILPPFAAQPGAVLEDQAILPAADWQAGEALAFTTDSFVVDPLEFPGGDIGTLAIAGTVNDLAVGGAVPAYLSLGLILEEGLSTELLGRILANAAEFARRAGVSVVTGDTKVVPRGMADKLYINTSGIGRVAAGINLSASRAQPGDAVLLSGDIGRHGAAIFASRQDLHLQAAIDSDCALLHELTQAMLRASPGIRCMRDATRGGVAAVLNEIAEASRVAIQIDEGQIPVAPTVEGLCELLGLDPLHLACEGRLLAVVPDHAAEAVLAAMRSLPVAGNASCIGRVVDGVNGRVTMRTVFGGERIVDMLVGEALPRIC